MDKVLASMDLDLVGVCFEVTSIRLQALHIEGGGSQQQVVDWQAKKTNFAATLESATLVSGSDYTEMALR